MPGEFRDELRNLISLNYTSQKGAAKMIEPLATALGFVIAMAAEGDEKKMNDVLEGITQHVFAAAAHHREHGALIGPSVNSGRKAC
jgi:hypothetical protein